MSSPPEILDLTTAQGEAAADKSPSIEIGIHNGRLSNKFKVVIKDLKGKGRHGQGEDAHTAAIF